MSDQSESRVIAARREKVDQIKEEVINPYPNDFKRFANVEASLCQDQFGFSIKFLLRMLQKEST